MSDSFKAATVFLLSVIAVLVAIFSFLYWNQQTNKEQAAASVSQSYQWPDATKVSSDSDTWPAVLQNKKDVITPLLHWPARMDGLTGWIVKSKGKGLETQSILYTGNDGNLLLIGGLIDKDGNNVSRKAFSKYAFDFKGKKSEISAMSKVSGNKETTETGSGNSGNDVATTSDGKPVPNNAIQNIKLTEIPLETALKTQPKVIFGSGDKQLHIVVDPHCPYCHHYFQTIMAHKDKLFKQYTLTFMPVGILGLDSIREAALFKGKSMDDKRELLTKMMDGNTVKDQPSSDDLQASIKRTKAWGSAGLNMVPLTIAHLNNETNRIALPGVQDILTLAALTNTSLAPSQSSGDSQ